MATCPIRKIPTEILLRVCMILSSDLFYEEYSILETPDLPPLSVVQVCAEWRAKLLNYGPFWSKIRLGGASQGSWLDELGLRSKECALDVIICMDPYFAPRPSPHNGYRWPTDRITNIDHAFRYISRIRSLEIHAYYNDVEVTYARLGESGFNAPLLEHWSTERLQTGLEPKPGRFVQPSIHAPRLRSLQTRFWPILQSGCFDNLRKVDLSNNRLSDILLVTNNFIKLSSFPALEALRIQTTTYFELPDPSESSVKIRLPRLKRVLFISGLYPFLYFLARAQTHPDCSFELRFSHYHSHSTGDWSSAPADALVQDATKIWQNMAREHYFDMQLWDSGCGSLDMVPSSPNSSYTLRLCTISDGTKPHTRRHPNPTGAARVFCYMLKHISGPMEARITLNGEFSLVKNRLLEGQTMLSVTDLTLHNSGQHIFTDLFSILQNPPRYLPIPNLRVLRLIGKTDGYQQSPPAEIAKIKNLFESSKAIRCPLKLLDISGLDPDHHPLHTFFVELAPTLEAWGVELKKAA